MWDVRGEWRIMVPLPSSERGGWINQPPMMLSHAIFTAGRRRRDEVKGATLIDARNRVPWTTFVTFSDGPHMSRVLLKTITDSAFLTWLPITAAHSVLWRVAKCSVLPLPNSNSPTDQLGLELDNPSKAKLDVFFEVWMDLGNCYSIMLTLVKFTTSLH